jgi:hypothetical protein
MQTRDVARPKQTLSGRASHQEKKEKETKEESRQINCYLMRPWMKERGEVREPLDAEGWRYIYRQGLRDVGK